jgi:serine protease Do
MNARTLLPLGLAVLLLCSAGASQAEPAETLTPTIRQRIDRAVNAVRPALVRIHVVSTDYRQGRAIKYEGSGSGVIISEDGYVLSNHHVAGHAARIVCTLANNEEIAAELVGTDALSDISVIRLLPEDGRSFPAARFGDSSALEVGDHVLAMGSPLAISQSVTLGIVSNTKMVMPRLFWPFDRFQLDGEDVGSIVRWIAHDAAIYGGNSGGPLVNLDGEIIGINEMRMGLSGAIPGNLARDVAAQLIEFGSVKRSWLGLEVQPLLKHGPHESGVLISGAIEGSPAEKAGFESGDILTALNGEPVSVRFREELPLFNRQVAALPIGVSVKASILRDGEAATVEVTTIEREEAQPRERELKPWGLTVRDLGLVTSKEMKLETRDGVLVTSVRPGGPAGDAKPAIWERDVILSVDGQAVTNVADLAAWTRVFAATHDEPAPVKVEFRRKADRFMTIVEVGISELEDPGLEARKAWIPIGTQVITRDLARELGRPEMTGVRVTQVYPESTAEAAGLQVGDLLLSVDGDRIPSAHPEDYEILPAMIRQYRIGSTVELAVIRNGNEEMIPVTLERSPKLAREMRKYRDENFEFTAREVAFFDKMQEGWEEKMAGVLVSEVQQGGWAAIAHLGVDDLILSIDGVPVPDVDALEKKMKALEAAQADSVVFKVLRGIYTMYLEIEPQWEENS